MAVTKKVLKTKPEARIPFEVDATSASNSSQIYLIGEFAEWEPVELKKQKGGSFKTTVKIPTDKQESYQFCYRYILSDGSEQYANESSADGFCTNPFGGENSVLRVAQV